MLRRNRSLIAGLLLATLVLAACTTPSQPNPTPQAESPSLERIRKYVAGAMDSEASSDQRRAARDEAMRSLLAYLETPASMQVPQSEWQRPAVTGAGPAVRVFESAKVKLYALALPTPGVVPPGERVVVQHVTGGRLQVAELQTLPGGSLAAAQAVEEAGQVHLIAAFALTRGGGYVGVYARDSKTGEYKVTSSAIKGLPSRIGEVTLEPKDQFLLLSWPLPDPWRPRMEGGAATRLVMDTDLALEWKSGRLVPSDERSFSALQSLQTALDRRAAPVERSKAWEKALEKLPTYLREMASWNEELAPRLPPGAKLSQDQAGSVAVRVISVPPPDDIALKPMTVVQHRIAGGLPQAQMLQQVGVVQGVRVISRQGLPGLLLMADETPAGSPTGFRRYAVTILRQTAGSDWEPAPDWFGFIPSAPAWRMDTKTRPGTLLLESERANAQATVVLLTEGPVSMRLCTKPDQCAALTWVGESLAASDWIADQINVLTAKPGQVTPVQIQQAAQSIAKLLSTPEVEGLSSSQVATLLGTAHGISVLEAGGNTRVVALPFNPTGEVPLVISAGRQAVADSPAPRVVESWVEARVMEVGNARWLLVIGRGRGAWVVIPYLWSENQWRAASLMDSTLDRVIGTRARLSYSPAQTYPVRGFWAYGADNLLIGFGPDGKTVRFCEGTATCLTLRNVGGHWSVQ